MIEKSIARKSPRKPQLIVDPFLGHKGHRFSCAEISGNETALVDIHEGKAPVEEGGHFPVRLL